MTRACLSVLELDIGVDQLDVDTTLGVPLAVGAWTFRLSQKACSQWETLLLGLFWD